MFRLRYVPLVEWERLTPKFLDLRHGSESVTEIINMLTERAMFCPEFAASEQAQMARYLGMLKLDIQQFVSTQHYGLLVYL